MSGAQKGWFVTLEGIEGGGKSTQLNYLAELFRQQDREVLTTREPGGTRIGELVRDIVLANKNTELHRDTELLLMFAARSQHYQQLIQPAIAAGKVVISDRFADASYAYQGAGRGIAEDRIDQLYQWVLGNFRPDLTLLFNIDLKQGMERTLERSQADLFNPKSDRGMGCDGRGTDRFEEEHIAFFEQVRKYYLKLAQAEPERIKVVNASQDPERVRAALKSILQKSKLWR